MADILGGAINVSKALSITDLEWTDDPDETGTFNTDGQSHLDISSGSECDDDEGQESARQSVSKHCLDAIGTTVTCLWMLPLRDPAPVDRLSSKTAEKVSKFKDFDQAQIKREFPTLDPRVRERFATMTTLRRELLQYRKYREEKRLKQKSAKLGSERELLHRKDDCTHLGPRSVSLSARNSINSEMPSDATTFRENNSQRKPETFFRPAAPISNASVSQAPSINTARNLKILVPKVLGIGEEYPKEVICEYCRTPQTIISDESWKKHVLKDLEPYVCTFADCTANENFFENRDVWYRHELDYHRYKFFCNDDSHQAFRDPNQFRAHLREDHYVSQEDSEIPMDWFKQSTKPAGDCNLCGEPAENLKMHVATHLEMIATFAIPSEDFIGPYEQPSELNSDQTKLSVQFKSSNDVRSSQMGLQNAPSDLDAALKHSVEQPQPTTTEISSIEDAFWQRNADDPDVPDSKDVVWDDITSKSRDARDAWSEPDPDHTSVVTDGQDSLVPFDLLRRRLYDCRKESDDRFVHYIPECDLRDIITSCDVSDFINQLLATDPTLSKDAATVLVDKIRKNAIYLFATLIYIRKADRICALLEEGVSDADLPLQFESGKDTTATLRRGTQTPVQDFVDWTDRDRTNFIKKQFMMLAPVFKFGAPILELQLAMVLPFTKTPNHSELSPIDLDGGVEVYECNIHPAHPDFWQHYERPESKQCVVIKRCHSARFLEFERERDILVKLRPNRHPHIVKLFATFKHGDSYHLIFPWADATLNQYWRTHAIPKSDTMTIKWVLRQIIGITHALVYIHDFRTSVPLGANRAMTASRDADVNVSEETTRYGCHGDVSPRSFLWLVDCPDSIDSSGAPDPMGVLQIANFGFSNIYEREDVVYPCPEDFTDTYEPPEHYFGQPVTRKYDIWGLGCVFLEFVTWIVKGHEASWEFADRRAVIEDDTRIGMDHFYEIEKYGSGREEAILKGSVVAWANSLHSDPKCSLFIHDMLVIIMKYMLVVDQELRSSALDIWDKLQSLASKAEDDQDYLTQPAPRPSHAQYATCSVSKPSRRSLPGLDRSSTPSDR